MVGNDAARLAAAEAAAALQQCVTNKLATLHATKKKAYEAHALVHTIVLLLKEEQASASTLEAEATVAALQLVATIASSSMPPPPSSRGDVAIVTMLHVQDCGVQNIRSLVSTVLDPFSTGYRWRDLVLLTLKCYDLTDHVLSDSPPINDPTCERMESIILS
jgi:hypothetical protein